MRISMFLPFRIQFWLLRMALNIVTRGVKLGRPGFFALLLRNYAKRPEWLLYPQVKLPHSPIAQRPRDARSQEVMELCSRLIAAYKASTREADLMASVGGPWKGIINKRYQMLIRALETGSEESLGSLLSGMFQESFLYGVASADVGVDRNFAPFLRMKLIEEILALAEYRGVVRAETPEQGVLGHSLDCGLEKLVSAVETDLGIRIDFPRVGGAYGIHAGDRLITPEAPEHIYVAERISKWVVGTPAGTGARIVEIGAGFGGTAYWLMQFLKGSPPSSYTIIDLPLMNVCQGYFLSRTFGSSEVRLYGEPPTRQSRFQIMPPHALSTVGTPFDLLVNENSMPEMPRDVVRGYLSWAREHLQGVFYSYNQEAYSPVDGIEQTLVPSVVREVGGFVKKTRNPSWIRRGYVEEVYQCGGF